MNGKFSLKKLIVSLLVVVLAGLIGWLFSINAKDIYQTLNLPSFAPPAAAFGIIWPIMYLLMAFSAYRISMLRKPHEKDDAYNALSYYTIQLIFNVLWSVLFFGFQLRGAALADIVILLFYVILTTIRFFKLDKLAGYVMIPYILWVLYATILNIAVVFLN